MRRLTIATVLVLAVAFTIVAAAGGQEAATFTNAVEVNVVNLDVTVRDRDKMPVIGLGPQDFRILRDGVEVPLSNFSLAGEGRAPDAFKQLPPSSATIDKLSTVQPSVQTGVQPSWLVLHIDNENILPIQRKRVLRQLRQFVDASLNDSVQMAVVSSRRSRRSAGQRPRSAGFPNSARRRGGVTQQLLVLG